MVPQASEPRGHLWSGWLTDPEDGSAHPHPGPVQSPARPHLTEPDLSGQVLDELRGPDVLRELILVLCQRLRDPGVSASSGVYGSLPPPRPSRLVPSFPPRQDHAHPTCHGPHPSLPRAARGVDVGLNLPPGQAAGVRCRAPRTTPSHKAQTRWRPQDDPGRAPAALSPRGSLPGLYLVKVPVDLLVTPAQEAAPLPQPMGGQVALHSDSPSRRQCSKGAQG